MPHRLRRISAGGTGVYAPTDKGTFSTHMFWGLMLNSHLFWGMISTLECSVHFTFYHTRSTPKSVGFVFLFLACCFPFILRNVLSCQQIQTHIASFRDAFSCNGSFWFQMSRNNPNRFVFQSILTFFFGLFRFFWSFAYSRPEQTNTGSFCSECPATISIVAFFNLFWSFFWSF